MPRHVCHRPFRPIVETLEGRTLLSVCTVDRLTDLGQGSGLTGDLRYCITQAQNGDSVTFSARGTINLTRVLPNVARSISIEGPGAELLTVRRDSGGNYTVLTVVAGINVSVSGITITNGSGTVSGGGIDNRGSLTLTRCTVTGNYGNEFGGGINNTGRLTIDNCAISGNRTSGGGGGGAIFNDNGTITLSNSTIARNTAGAGGGVYNNGTLTVSNSTLSENNAGGAGGGVYNNGTLTVSNSTLSENNAGNDGAGGIANNSQLTVSNSTLSGNTAAGPGGAIFNGGTSMLSNSTIARNTVTRGGGGGVSNSGTLAVSNSTFSENNANNVSGNGGGGIDNGNQLTVSNSTLSGNTARTSGGAIVNRATGRINNSTITNNTATFQGGGISGSMTVVRNTIIAGNTAITGPDVDGNIGSDGYNLIGNTRDGSGFHATDLLNVNPRLGPLQDNGGPTRTHALLPGSPAIEAGDPSFQGPPDTDQRGLLRVFGYRLDIGAYEFQAGTSGYFYVYPELATVAPGVPFDLYVIALDALGEIMTDYTGEIQFWSTDVFARHPYIANFRPEDQGIAYFPAGVTLFTPGRQGLLVFDTATFSLWGNAVFDVEGDFPGPGSGPDGVGLLALGSGTVPITPASEPAITPTRPSTPPEQFKPVSTGQEVSSPVVGRRLSRIDSWAFGGDVLDRVFAALP